MPKQLQLYLTDKKRAELIDLCDHADQPYLRERAAALLKIADGGSARQVAAQGLLRKRWHYTLGVWLTRYEQDGIEGLKIRSGRGRKPAFSPSARNC
jgi:hypothetical protein